MKPKMLLSYVACLLLGCSVASAIDPALQAKIDDKVKTITAWGSDAGLVAAVKEVSAKAGPAVEQTEWEKATILDPKVRGYQTNAVGTWLKAKKTDWVAEAFVSLSDGAKAGFLGKTTSFSHKGKPKHETPMSGKIWQGELEMDQSSGKQEIQVSVPVSDGGKPIASLVVGLDVSKL